MANLTHFKILRNIKVNYLKKKKKSGAWIESMTKFQCVYMSDLGVKIDL